MLDMAQAYHQLTLEETDMQEMAFRNAMGRLVEFTVYSFGLTTIPAVYSAHLGDDLLPNLGRGVREWLNDFCCVRTP